MSWEAYKWVTCHAPIPKPDSARIVLYGLAEHAGPDGTASFPSKNTLAGYILGEEVSEQLKLEAHAVIDQGEKRDPLVMGARDYLKRTQAAIKTVKRSMPILKDGGWITEGDQSLVAHFPHYRRPKVWDLNLTLTRAMPSGTGDSTDPRGQYRPRVTTQTPGDNPVQTQGQDCPDPGTILSRPGDSTVPQTSLKPPSKPSEEPPARSAPPGLPPAAAGGGEGGDDRADNSDSFDSIWQAWPTKARKSDKRHKAMSKFLKAADALGSEQAVIDRFNRERPDLVPTVGMVATWFNKIIREAGTSPTNVVALKDRREETDPRDWNQAPVTL